MQFEGSTQARSWIFDEQSLRKCRKQATVGANACSTGGKRKEPLARKFASGFHRRGKAGSDATEECRSQNDKPTSFGVIDQETYIRFHAQQIQTLVGPTALLPELRRSALVLSTAVMLFRRFYLSNSAIEISARKIATACAFFAGKLEEERIEISLLSHATAVVQQKVHGSSLCRRELSAVSISDIEDYETILMEGLNYQFICHHAHASLGFLVRDVVKFVREEKHPSLDVEICSRNNRKSRGVWRYDCWLEEHVDELLQRTLRIVQRANVFSDVPFLFSPGQIAFAAVAIVFESVYEDGYLGDTMQDFLVTRHPMLSEDELLSYSRNVSRIISILLNSDLMDLRPITNARKMASEREVHRVLCMVDGVRSRKHAEESIVQTGKRKRRPMSMVLTPPRGVPYHKMAKVTPTGGYH